MTDPDAALREALQDIVNFWDSKPDCKSDREVRAQARAALAATASPGHRQEWDDGVPTGWCECGKVWQHQTASPQYANGAYHEEHGDWCRPCDIEDAASPGLDVDMMNNAVRQVRATSRLYHQHNLGPALVAAYNAAALAADRETS